MFCLHYKSIKESVESTVNSIVDFLFSFFILFYFIDIKVRIISDRLTCGETGVFSRPRFLFFFFFFFLCVNSNLTWIHCLHTVYYCSCTVHVLKNIKNESHDTIYTFKNYFATVFSVFSFQF